MVLETLDPKTGESIAKPSIGEFVENQNDGNGDDSVIAPQIMIGEDGNIIIDQERLVS